MEKFMKKKAVIIISVLFIVLAIPAILAIVLLTRQTSDSTDLSGVTRLDYEDTLDGNYDTDLMYQNLLKINNGDPGGLWVSEEDDPVYGGYCYVAVTTLNNNLNTYEYPVLGFDSAKDDTEDKNNYYKGCGFEIYRSKDLSNWEICGAIDGSGLGIKRTDWIDTWTWAPELIRDDVSGMYFLYFSASVAMGNPYVAKSDAYQYDRMYLGVAMSESPMGPYEVVTTDSYYSLYAKKDSKGNPVIQNGYLIGENGEKITTVNANRQIENLNGDVITEDMPPINFGSETALKYIDGMDEKNIWPCIDASFFQDSEGRMYMSFVSHQSSYKASVTEDVKKINYDRNDIWIVEMKDHITPDYSTLSLISVAGFKSVKAQERYVKDAKTGETYRKVNVDPRTFEYGEAFIEIGEGNNVNEGPFMLERNGKYYLYYAPCGTGNMYYSICQAVADNPFGPYTKLTDYNPVIGMNQFNDYMVCTGHHSFVYMEDEIFALFHCFWGETQAYGRTIAADRVKFMYNEELGYDIMYGNGPTLAVQPGNEILTGYSNVAYDAKITTTEQGEESTLEYLTDGIFTAQEYTWDKEFTSNGKSVVKLEWDKPQEVSAIFIYNSAYYYTAFNKINNIIFTLSDGSKVAIEELKCNPANVNENNLSMRQGGGAVAYFDPIEITAMEFEVSSKYIYEYEDGTEGENTVVNISEIYVMGKGNE